MTKQDPVVTDHSPFGESAFAILPDCESTFTVRSVLPAAAVLARHPSGHPLLIGSLNRDRISIVGKPGSLTLIIGQTPLDAAGIESCLARVKRVKDFEELGGKLPGSYHAMFVHEGSIYARGTNSNLRRLYFNDGSGTRVVSNRADVIAAAVSADIDPRSAALRLVVPGLPSPLSSSSMWKNVSPVPAGQLIRLKQGGMSLRQWWDPPDPMLQRSEVTSALREAFRLSIRATDAGSSDLSGGMDSTPITYLAWQRNPNLTAITLSGLTTDDDDTDIAAEAVRAMPGVRHIVLDRSEIPLPFEGMLETAVSHDEPYLGLQSGRFLHVARTASKLGSTNHLSGHGGDEVLTAPPSYVHGLVRRKPLVALDHIRGQMGLRRWSLNDVVRLVATKQTYSEWLRSASENMSLPLLGFSQPPTSWNAQMRLPGWVTPECRKMVSESLLEASESASPLAQTREQHTALERIRGAGRVSRLIRQLMAEGGVDTATPFLDDAVIDLCLSVRPEERSSPWKFKPLLTEALADVVPHRLIQRSTKNDMSEDVYAGFRSQRGMLAELCSDLRLADLGLVDAELFRKACLSPQPPGQSLPALVMTLNCEAWLRAANSGPNELHTRQQP